MKSIVFTLSILLLMTSSMALDQVTIEADHCTDMVWQGRSPGYFKIRDPLFYSSEDGLHSIQIVMVRNEPSVVWRKPSGAIKLRGNLERVRDFIVHDSILWLLSGDRLISFSQRGLKLSEHQFKQGLNIKDFPHSLVSVEDKFYIAHGGLGLIRFDSSTYNFDFVSSLKTFQEKGRSLAVSLTYDESASSLIVLHTGNSKGAFNGLVSFNLNTNQMDQELAYDSRRDGVIDRYGLVYSLGSAIYINNGGWIHQFKRLSSKKQRPRWLAIRDTSRQRPSFVRVRGDFIFSENSLFGCGVLHPQNRGDKRVGKLFSRRL